MSDKKIDDSNLRTAPEVVMLVVKLRTLEREFLSNRNDGIRKQLMEARIELDEKLDDYLKINRG